MENSTRTQAERTPDGKLIDQLAKSGSDLTKLHQFEFTLRFPSQLTAERAELQLVAFAFSTRVEPGKIGEERIIRATKVMYPVESDLQGLREKLDAIAVGNRGAYEGWKAKVK
ncbi:MAG: ribonuclease E inhibitor RraB [Pseudomonadota bacterium]